MTVFYKRTSCICALLTIIVIATLTTKSSAFVPLQKQQQQQHQDATLNSQFRSRSSRRNAASSGEDSNTNVVSSDDDTSFKEATKRLCVERNIKFNNIKNARDLASIKNSPIVPGKIFRTGRVSDANDEDIEKMMNELKIKTLIDLRSPTELKDDPTLMNKNVFKYFTDVVWKEKHRKLYGVVLGAKKRDGMVRTLEDGEEPVKLKMVNQTSNQVVYNKTHEAVVAYTACVDRAIVDDEGLGTGDFNEVCEIDYDVMHIDEDDEQNLHKYVPVKDYQYNGRRERIFVSLMNELKYVRGTLSKLRKRDLANSLWKTPGTIFSRRVRNAFKKPFLDVINGGGLPMLNELLMRYGAPGIKYVLEICADERRHPVAFYCTAGKDRTGIIAAIILALCGAKKEDIIEDYTLSANVYAEMNDHKAMVGALSQRSLDPGTFLTAPPHVMKDTLDIMEEQYGSVEEYCNWIGFGPESQDKLRSVLMIDAGKDI